jgi:hypothetical protein
MDPDDGSRQPNRKEGNRLPTFTFRKVVEAVK